MTKSKDTAHQAKPLLRIRIRLLRLCLLAVFLLAGVLLATGCNPLGQHPPPKQPSTSVTTSQGSVPPPPDAGQESRIFSEVYTTKRELALTFDGMADKALMVQLLDELDRLKIQATFFLPGMRVAEEPDIARDILARGHEIENNTLNRLNSAKLTYEDMYREIKLSGEVIHKATGVTPHYVRMASVEHSQQAQQAAGALGYQAVVESSLYLHNWTMEKELEKRHYLRKYINRGGIIALDTAEHKQLLTTLPLLADAAEAAGYRFVSLSQLIQEGNTRKPLTEIAGYHSPPPAPASAPTDNAASYTLFSHGDRSRKEVALTFDDWGTDETVTRILDILNQYGVKASFFLRADGVERNPNLARAIAEAGHDVGNHTYSHPVITKITEDALREEVVKAHEVIAQAIQQQPTMLFRPPTGDFSTKALQVIASCGYRKIALFDVVPTDHDRSRSAKDIVKTVITDTQNGSMILLHLLDDTHTAEALPGIIEGLRSKGYKLVRVSDMAVKPD